MHTQIPNAAELTGACWRRSSYSGQGGGQCVELAPLQASVAVRDSKDPHGPAMLLTQAAFGQLLTTIATDEQ